MQVSDKSSTAQILSSLTECPVDLVSNLVRSLSGTPLSLSITRCASQIDVEQPLEILILTLVQVIEFPHIVNFSFLP